MKTKWTHPVVAAPSVATVAAVDAQRGAFGKVRSAAIANKLGLSEEQKTQMQPCTKHTDATVVARKRRAPEPRTDERAFFRSSRADGTDPHPASSNR